MATLESTGSTGRLIGYARVSTSDQDTALQRKALDSAGVNLVYEEKLSAVKHRPALERMLADLRPGDVLHVYKVDRLARSLGHLLSIFERIEAAGASFRSLTEPIETGSLVGRMMLQLLGAFAEFERGMIRERCAAGRAAAVDRGVRFGRARKIDYGRVRELLSQGLRPGAIADELGCDRSTIAHLSRAWRKGLAGPYIPVAARGVAS